MLPKELKFGKNYGRVTWSGVATEVREFPGTFHELVTILSDYVSCQKLLHDENYEF